MDDPFNFTLPPASLAQICTAKVAVSMLNHVLENQPASHLNQYEGDYVHYKNRLLGNVERLQIPGKLRLFLRDYSAFTLSEMSYWYSHFASTCYSSVRPHMRLTNQVLSNVAWTGRGEVDRKQTARNILTTDNLGLDIYARFRLSCTFYLEDSVRQLWNEMDPECEKSNRQSIKRMETFEVVFWTLELLDLANESYRYVKEKLGSFSYKNIIDILDNDVARCSSSCPRYVYWLVYSLYESNSYSASYFINVCNDVEKAIAIKSRGFDIGPLYRHKEFFYFSMLSQEYLEGLFEADPENVYQVFHSLPSEIFIRVFRKLKHAIDHRAFFQVLLAIAEHDLTKEDGYISPLDMNWGKVFRDIWIREINDTYRNDFLNLTDSETDGATNLVDTLYSSGHYDSIELIIMYQTRSQRMGICNHVLHNEYMSESTDRFLERFITCLEISKDDLEYLKNVPFDNGQIN